MQPIGAGNLDTWQADSSSFDDQDLSMRNGSHPNDTLNRGRALCVAVLVATMATACTGMQMKPYYEKDMVQSLKVERAGEGELLLGFYVQPETMYYPSGVNYEVSGGTLRVAIDRCAIREACNTMVRDTRELSPSDPMQVRIPYRGERVVLVHADGEQIIYP
ncbi:MAG TPA: hypothetical protein VFE72_11780 [Lysobacter sp.]|nr:hypothetical protein [Lysobacter sp.]